MIKQFSYIIRINYLEKKILILFFNKFMIIGKKFSILFYNQINRSIRKKIIINFKRNLINKN